MRKLKGMKRLSKISVLIIAENGFVIFDLNSLMVRFFFSLKVIDIREASSSKTREHQLQQAMEATVTCYVSITCLSWTLITFTPMQLQYCIFHDMQIFHLRW